MATNPLIQKPNALTQAANLPMSTMETPTPSAVVPAKPVKPINPVLSTSQINKVQAPAVIDNSGVIKNIQNTLAKYTAEAGANSDFVKGAIKASGQKETPELLAQYTGKKLGDVISGLGLGEKVGYTATPATTTVPVAQKGTSDATLPKDGEVVKPKTSIDYLNDIEASANAMEGNIDQVYKDAGVQTKAEEVNRLTGDLNMLDTNENIRNVMNNVEAQDLKDQFTDFQKEQSQTTKLGWQKGLILGQKQEEINAKLTGLSSQDVRDLATYTLNRTNLAQQVQVAQGNYQIASDIAKQSVESMKWAFDQKLKIAQERNQITKDEATMAQQAFNNEMELSSKGMVAIPDTDLQKVQADIASGKKDGTIVTNPVNGKSYYKPSVEDETSKALVLDMAGKYVDAGILPTDTLAVAQSKLKNSKIYQDQVRGPVGSETTKLTTEEKAVQTDINAELDKLSKGTSDWGTSWNYIKNRYPDIPTDILDEALRKDQFYPKEEAKSDKKWFEFWK